MIGFVGVSGFGVRVEQNARVRGRVQGVVMMAAKPLKVNTDMKGAPVWTLREATSEDAGKIAGLGDVFDANLVDGLISTSEGSALVASVNLKGGEEGGDQAQLTNVVVGAVLPNVSKDVTVPGGPADQKLKMTGDIALLTVSMKMTSSSERGPRPSPPFLLRSWIQNRLMSACLRRTTWRRNCFSGLYER
uniref:Uncharacterized protein n=1 Tax=Rhodosorus marinus TaxID=101924 RepID=A0A7S2ZMT2_9RHOD|mmetsp:Transcript_25298/g.99912  ORF Transcript_25298/g.99912 Transcript_25298/m.99912 type:complete len:190 (+) Transcript_25298:171-740(+)